MKKFLIVIMICFALLYKSELHAFEYQYDVYGDMIFTLTDVKEDFWAFKDIKSMFLSELITGYPDGSFQPQNSMNRAEMMSILNRYIKTLKDTYAPTRRIRALKQEEKNEKERLKKQQQEIEDKKYEADLTYLNEGKKWFKGGTPKTGDVKVENGKKHLYVSDFDWIPWQMAHKGGGIESEGKGYIPSPYQIGDGVNRKMSKEEYIQYVKCYNIDWDKLGITIDDAVKHYFKEELSLKKQP